MIENLGRMPAESVAPLPTPPLVSDAQSSDEGSPEDSHFAAFAEDEPAPLTVPAATAAQHGSSGYRRWLSAPWRFVVSVLDFARRALLAGRWLITQWIGSRPGLLVRMAEIFLWPVFFIYLSWFSNSANPLYIDEGFPWPWLGVWLIAMRYGALGGSIAGVILLASWYFLIGGAFPRLYFLGGAIMTIVAGEFGSLWQARMTRFREAMMYQDDKIERLTRRLYLLKLSHDELEYEMVDRPGTLRDALIELRSKLTPPQDRQDDMLPGAQDLLAFLAHYGQLEVAALHLYIDGPVPSMQSRAHIGHPPQVDASDPMIERALLTRQSVHLQEHLVDSTRKSALILVAPILDAKGATLGLLTVNRMPFLALQADNLRTVWVITQAYAEYLRSAALAQPLAQLWPQSPMELQHEFAWLQRLNIDTGLQSWAVLWYVRGVQSHEIAECIKQEHSSAEMCWTFKRGNRLMVLSLLPFATVQRLTIYKRQIFLVIERNYGELAAKKLVEGYDLSLEQSQTWSQLHQWVEGRT